MTRTQQQRRDLNQAEARLQMLERSALIAYEIGDLSTGEDFAARHFGCQRHIDQLEYELSLTNHVDTAA